MKNITKSYDCILFLKAFLSFLQGLFLCGLLCLPAQSAPKTAVATRIDVQTQGDTTLFTAELTTVAAFTATALTNPDRVVIDLADVGFKLPTGAGRKVKGLVRQVRYGVIEKGKSRIVIDTDGPVKVQRTELLPKKGKAKPRLVVAIVAAPLEVTSAAPAASPEITASLPVIMPVVPVATPAPDAGGKRIVVIDPGHGGMDPGAIGRNKTKEKDVVFAFAQALQKALAETGRFDARLTREQDRFMSLNDRLAFTKRAKADLFIAIHADTLRGKTATGTTLYTLSDTASDAEAEALAQKENRADIIAGVNLEAQPNVVADVLIELVQRESRNLSNLFSRTAVEELKGATTMTGKPIRSAGFVVLRSPDVPSVLIELGFLSNPEDEDRMKDAAWRTRMAGALSRAVGRYFTTAVAAE